MGTLAPSQASPRKKENQTLLNNKSFHLLTVQRLRYETSCLDWNKNVYTCMKQCYYFAKISVVLILHDVVLRKMVQL